MSRGPSKLENFSGGRPFDFSTGQERRIVLLQEAIFFSSFGFFVSGCAKGLNVAANTMTGSLGMAGMTAMGVARDLALAGLLYRLGSIYEEIVLEEGRDVDRFVSSLSKAGGLNDYFAQTAGVIGGISRFQVFDAVARLFIVFGAKYLGLETWDTGSMVGQLKMMVAGR